MKKSERIFEILKKNLHSQQFIDEYKLFPKAFIRNRLLPFSVIFLFILNLVKKSIPKELNSFSKNLEISRTSRSAITQARAKISSRAYIKLNEIFIEEFYKNNFKMFQGFILLAIDGSILQLPDSPELIEKYGCISNQTEKEMPSARCSILYDVLNQISLNAQLKPLKLGERDIAIEHFEAIKALNVDITKFLVIFDRGYPSLALMYYLIRNGINFLIRSGTGFLKEVNDILNSNEKDVIVKITPKRLKRIHKSKTEISQLFPGIDLKDNIVFRVLIMELKTGEKEILLTSLLSKKNYPYGIFQTLYFMRWGLEEHYKFIKGIEIENFSGKSILAIEQDFHATIFVANSHSLLALEAQEELDYPSTYLDELCTSDKAIAHSKMNTLLCENRKKYKYYINKRVSIEMMKHEFVKILLNPQSDVEAFCVEIKKMMKQELVPKRPNRSSQRTHKNTRRKFHMNRR